MVYLIVLFLIVESICLILKWFFRFWYFNFKLCMNCVSLWRCWGDGLGWIWWSKKSFWLVIDLVMVMLVVSMNFLIIWWFFVFLIWWVLVILLLLLRLILIFGSLSLMVFLLIFCLWSICVSFVIFFSNLNILVVMCLWKDFGFVRNLLIFLYEKWW